MNIDQARQYLQDHQIRYVLAQFVDIHGVAKTKSVPAEHLETIVSDGAGFAGFAAWGFGMGPNGPDYMARADLSTLTALPWMPGYARVACDGYVRDSPYPYCSRVVLKQQLDRLKAQGLMLYTGIEPEFMLLKRGSDGALLLADGSDQLEKPCYDFKGLSHATAFLEQLVEGLKPSGLDVYQIDHEDANGQFEVNYTYADALTTADRLVLLRMAACDIAGRMGMICSFMPKPFSTRTGSGAHFHISLGDDRNSNLFHDESDARGLKLSKMAYHFTAGLMAHGRALAAVAAPTVNSYKRLVVGRALSGATWAPAYIAYGDNNRTAMVRIPGGRIELRLPDASCNPYLATAAILAAGMDGVRRELQAPAPIDDNLYDWSPAQIAEAGIDLLPQTLGEAIAAFESDAVVQAALGPKLSAEFVTLKKMEWVEYCRHVSDWECRRYVDFF